MKLYKNKDELQILMDEYHTYKKVAEVLGCNEKTIISWCQKFNILHERFQGARKHKLNKSYFASIDSEEKAYWLGFLMADGCVYKGSSKNSYRLQINLSFNDRDCLEKLNESIESDYDIKDKYVYLKSTDQRYKISQLKINCTEMCLDLINHNVIPHKSLICKPPKISSDLYPHYLRGYFDGDGCITQDKRKRWTVSIVGGDDMLTFFQEYLEDNNIVQSIYGCNHSKAKTLQICSKKSVMNFYKLIYERATIFYERKHIKFVEMEKDLSLQSEMIG